MHFYMCSSCYMSELLSQGAIWSVLTNVHQITEYFHYPRNFPHDLSQETAHQKQALIWYLTLSMSCDNSITSYKLQHTVSHFLVFGFFHLYSFWDLSLLVCLSIDKTLPCIADCYAILWVYQSWFISLLMDI